VEEAGDAVGEMNTEEEAEGYVSRAGDGSDVDEYRGSFE